VVVEKQKQYVRPRSTALVAFSHEAGTKSLKPDLGRAYQPLSVAPGAAESHGMGDAVYRKSFSCSMLPGSTNTQTSHMGLRVSAGRLREGRRGFPRRLYLRKHQGIFTQELSKHGMQLMLPALDARASFVAHSRSHGDTTSHCMADVRRYPHGPGDRAAQTHGSTSSCAVETIK
jgi:hypothetical protein